VTTLVTGIGFVGAYVVRDLLAAGEDVVVYGLLGGRNEQDGEDRPDLVYLRSLVGDEAFERVFAVVADIADLDQLIAACVDHGVTRIAHLASLISVSSEENVPRAVRVNIEGTANAFEAARRLDLEKVVWASSINVYGPRSVNAAGYIDDSSPLDPATT
jgi:nucleoside-diphosphate-sugar epimerase